MQLDYIIKNKVSEQEFERIVYNWLSDGDYTPDDIIENIVTEKNIVLMPLYLFNNEYAGSCSASLGYRKSEDYYEWDSLQKKNVRKTRWVTEWHPYSQTIQGNTVNVVYSGQPAAEKLIHFVEAMGWEGDELLRIPTDAEYYAAMENLFKFSKDEIWEKRASKMAYATARQQTIPKLPSQIINNLSLDIRFYEKRFFNVLAPYWFFSYQYQGNSYYVAVDGNDNRRIDGIKPEDKKRKNEVYKIRLVGWLVGIMAIAIAMYIAADQTFRLLEFDLKNTCIAIAGIVLTAILVRYEVVKIKNKSKKIRQQTLAKHLTKTN